MIGGMTFCIGIRVDDGVVALSDTRIVRGSQISTKAKLSTVTNGAHSAVVMTSGLRSVRDKVMARLQDRLDHTPLLRMHELATAYGDELRTVRDEDGEALEQGGFSFNPHAVIGGRLAHDDEPTLFHVYPEGNWVEATVDEPAYIIGRTSYGKPILDRLLEHGTTLSHALTLAFLAFDATRTSASDVDFPIDVAVLPRDGVGFRSRRFEESDLADQHDAWNRMMREAVTAMPTEWAVSLTDEPRTDEPRTDEQLTDEHEEP
jgi:putative proteasome-type protease